MMKRAAAVLALSCLACASMRADEEPRAPERSVASLRDCRYVSLEPVEDIGPNASEVRKAVRKLARQAGGDAVINVQIESSGKALPVQPKLGPVTIGRTAPAALVRGRGTPIKYVSGDCSQ